MSQRIEDNSPAVSTSGSWIPSESDPQASGGTLISTFTNGASLSLSFSGTSISVVGTIGPTGTSLDTNPVSVYSIDGVQRGQYTGTMQSTTQYGVTFFSANNLSPGQHTLVITNQVPQGKIGLYSFDYAQVGGGGAANTPTPTPSTTNKQTSTQPNPSVTTKTTASSTPTQTSSLPASGTSTTASNAQPSGASSQSSSGAVTGTAAAAAGTGTKKGSGANATSGGGASSAQPTYAGAGNPDDPSGLQRIGGPNGISVPTLAGAISGGLVLIVLLFLLLWMRRRKRRGMNVNPLVAFKNMEGGVFRKGHSTLSTPYDSESNLTPGLHVAPWASETVTSSITTGATSPSTDGQHGALEEHTLHTDRRLSKQAAEDLRAQLPQPQPPQPSDLEPEPESQRPAPATAPPFKTQVNGLTPTRQASTTAPPPMRASTSTSNAWYPPPSPYSEGYDDDAPPAYEPASTTAHARISEGRLFPRVRDGLLHPPESPLPH